MFAASRGYSQRMERIDPAAAWVRCGVSTEGVSVVPRFRGTGEARQTVAHDINRFGARW
jgi:hypothetical protein